MMRIERMHEHCCFGVRHDSLSWRTPKKQLLVYP